MEELGHARSFRDLVVYQRARSVAKTIFDLTKSFPREEMYSLTDQIPRASRAVGAQIAEAWAKRRYSRHFVSKLTDADAEQHEVAHWVDTARECGYVGDEEAARMASELSEIGRMLNSTIQKADLFCGAGASEVRESAAGYFVRRPDP